MRNKNGFSHSFGKSIGVSWSPLPEKCSKRLRCIRCTGKAGCQTLRGTQFYSIVEVSEEHGICFGDGVQYATGCTLRKGNIRKLEYDKFILTLIDNKTGPSVRVITRNEVIKRNQESNSIHLRKKGIPASQIAAELIDQAVDFFLIELDENLSKINPVQEDRLTPEHLHDFNTHISDDFGEVMVDRYAASKMERRLAIFTLDNAFDILQSAHCGTLQRRVGCNVEKF